MAFKVIPGGKNLRYDNRGVSEAAEFERLYRESYSYVYNSVFFRMGDEEAACDVTAEAFLRAARFFSRYDANRAKFRTWVAQIARNCMYDWYAQHPKTSSIDEVPEYLTRTEEDHANAIVNAEFVGGLLKRLSEDDREIVFMRYYEDKRYAVIARELGMNESTVRTRLNRALHKMRSIAGGNA